MRTIKEVVEWHGGGGGWDECGSLLLAVGMQRGGGPGVEMGGEEWEDFLGGGYGEGWEWIDGEVGEGDGEKRNEFGGEL